MVKLTIFPGEIDLHEVYERINALESERARAKALCSLLVSSVYENGLPGWFVRMVKLPFKGTRGQSIRLSLDKRDPALASLLSDLDPLAHAQRVVHIKVLLRKMCAGKAEPTTPSTGEPSAAKAISYSHPPTLKKPDADGAEVTAKPTPEEDAAIRKRINKSGASVFFE